MAPPGRAGLLTSDDKVREILMNDESDCSGFEDSDEDDVVHISGTNSGEDSTESEDEDIQPPIPKRSKVNKPPNNFRIWDDETDSNKFTPTDFDFDDRNSGIQDASLTKHSSEVEIFKSLFPTTLVQKIAAETNLYRSQFMDSNPSISPQARALKWNDVTVEELYVFFGISLLMGHVNKHTIEEYWSTDPLLHTPIFSQLMSCSRYKAILQFLHFNDNTFQTQGDRLHKIRPVMEHIKQTFPSLFHPFQDLCIDESLVLFKGRLSFKQYIPSKRNRFGMKLFVLCDCDTGYVLDITLYTGATTELIDCNLGFSSTVVMTMIDPYLNLGHTLYIDNYYTSPDLFETLHSKKTHACGTVRKNRKGLPSASKKLKRGEMEEKHTSNILSVRWMDRREVGMLTTTHHSGMVCTGKTEQSTGQPRKLPVCVADYNKKMGPVDRSDQMITSVESTRRSIKWYKKLFFHLLEVTILNSFFVERIVRGDKRSLKSFRLEVVRSLTEEGPTRISSSSGGRPSSGDNPTRLTQRHFLSIIPPNEPGRRPPSRVCHVCAHTTKREKKNTRTIYHCKVCDRTLCPVPCFEDYHTKKHY